MKSNSLTQANSQPKTKNELIKEIFILTMRVGCSSQVRAINKTFRITLL
jgi:hypothetical protein